MTDIEGAKTRAKEGVAAVADELIDVSRRIHANPELAMQERQAAALLRAYDRVGGTCLQINMVDPATLQAAEADPEAYRNLLVRVTGYNAYFVMLGKEIEDEIIAREAHAR